MVDTDELSNDIFSKGEKSAKGFKVGMLLNKKKKMQT